MWLMLDYTETIEGAFVPQHEDHSSRTQGLMESVKHIQRRRTCSGRSWAWGEWIAPRRPVCLPDGWFLGGNTAGLQARRATADSSTSVHAPASTSGLFFSLKPAGWSRVSGARCGPRAPGCTRGPEERWAGKASSVSVPPAEGSAPEQTHGGQTGSCDPHINVQAKPFGA